MFGFLPAPYAYGAIFTYSNSIEPKEPKLALSLVFYYVCFGCALIFVGMLLRYKEFRDKELIERDIQVNFEKNKIEEKERKEELAEKNAIDNHNKKKLKQNDKNSVQVEVEVKVELDKVNFKINLLIRIQE